MCRKVSQTQQKPQPAGSAMAPQQLVDDDALCYYCLQTVDKKAIHLVLKCTQNCSNAGRLIEHSCHRQQLAHYRKNGGRSNFQDCCPKRPGDTCHGVHLVHEVTPKNERKKEQRIAAAQTHQPTPKRGPSAAQQPRRTQHSTGQQAEPSSRGPQGTPSRAASGGGTSPEAAAGDCGGGSGSRRSSCSDGRSSCRTDSYDSRRSSCSYDTGCSIDCGRIFLHDYFPPAPTKSGPPLCYADGFVPDYGFAPAVLYAEGGIQMTMNSVVDRPNTFHFDSPGGKPGGANGGPRARASCFDIAGDGLYTLSSPGPEPTASPPSAVQYEDLFPRPAAGGRQPAACSTGRVWPPARPKPHTSYAASVTRPGPGLLHCPESYPHLLAPAAVTASAVTEAGKVAASGASSAAFPPPSPRPARHGAHVVSDEEAILQYDLLLLDCRTGMVLVQYGGVCYGGMERAARRCARCSKLRVAVWSTEDQRRAAWLVCIPPHWTSAQAWK